LAALIYLDTHVAGWLFAGESARFPRRVQSRLEGRELRVSPMVVLELGLLHEIGRLRDPPRVIMDDLRARVGLQVCDEVPFSTIAELAANLTWTRDPFDRIIVAHAASRDLPLVTKDETIREHYPRAVWDGDEPRRARRARKT
jgi:PIN domain nuclease of toxin-antitoxin system